MATLRTHRLAPFILLTAISLLPVVFSCSDRSAQARLTIAAADSLITAAPQAALDTLMTIDSSDAARLPRADRVFHTLLRTEAGYKCYLPVAGNTTAISEAVDYYRRNGPEDRLARALVMQGAVLSEQGDTDGAMLAYKEAEPILERSGDPEQLGLLHTRIGELYQYTLVNIPESISRLKSAMNCFQKAHNDIRAAVAMLSLANLYIMADSSETGYKYLIKGLETAAISGDTLSILDGHLSLTGYYYHGDSADYLKCRSTALSAVRIIDESDSDYYKDAFANRLFNFIAKSYAMTGQTDSATHYLNKISGNDNRTTICRLSIKSLIASQKRDSITALKYKVAADSLYYNEKISGYQEDLRLMEKSSENTLLRIQLDNAKRRHTIDVLVIIIIILSAAILGLIVYNATKRIRHHINQNMELIRLLEESNRQKESELSEAHRLYEQLQRHLDKNDLTKAKWKVLHDSLIDMENLVLDTYFRYGSTSTLASRIKGIIDSHFPEKQTYGKILDILNLSYPGFIDSLREKHCSLTDKNLYLIALIACGFSTGAICALLRCSENTLYVTKTRIAKKIGLKTSLTSYIAGCLEAYHHIYE